MARGDDIKKILNLAKDMRDSTMGYSIQMIQDELRVSRRTAMRIKEIISQVFEVEEVPKIEIDEQFEGLLFTNDDESWSYWIGSE